MASGRKVGPHAHNPRGSRRSVGHIATVIMASGRKNGTPSRNPRVPARKVPRMATPSGQKNDAPARNLGGSVRKVGHLTGGKKSALSHEIWRGSGHVLDRGGADRGGAAGIA